MNAPDAPAVGASPFATLPRLAPTIPDTGKRVTLAPLAGSADALALAQLAVDCARAGRTLAVLAADPLAAQRLADEIPWFAPGVDCDFFPDWETLPYDPISPHEDLISTRLSTLYRLAQRERASSSPPCRLRCTGCRRPRSSPDARSSSSRASGSTSTSCARSSRSPATRT